MLLLEHNINKKWNASCFGFMYRRAMNGGKKLDNPRYARYNVDVKIE